MLARLLLMVLMAGAVSADLSAAELIAKGSSWKYMKGLSEASSPAALWRLPAFDDGSWEVGPAPLFYGEPLSGTLLSDMQGGYTSVFMRKTFVVSNPAAVEELQLETLSDDGCIVWINGNEVTRYNVPDGELPYNSASLPALSEPIPWELSVVTNASRLLVPGTNVLAVHGFNASLGSSSDFVFDAALSSLSDVVPPQALTILPEPRAAVRTLTTIEVLFSESVEGVDASDLLINGISAAEMRSSGPDDYIFTFPEPAAGEVQVSWSAGHGIHDLSPGANPFAGGSWMLTLDPNAPMPGIMISEFLADNDHGIHDEDGDSSDWIELYNPTAEAVDLGGWHLTTDTNNLTMWRFPFISLPANGYMIVFASEKNRTNPAGKLHTNFKLPSSGGLLALVDPRTNVMSWFNYPSQREDVSFGRERSNPALPAFFIKPTPGAANISGGPGFAPEVKFANAGGAFSQPFDLVLSTSSSNAVIRYVLGRDLPTETSPVYTGPIRISSTVQVRARAFEPGLLPGEPHSESFVQIAGPLLNFTSDLPVVVLHNYGSGAVPTSGEQFVMMQIFEPKNGVTSLTNAADFSERARFRRRGSSTEGYIKPSLALELWDEFDVDKKVKVLGMPAESDWVFYAPNNFEPVLIHNPFMYELSREIGRYASRTRFVEVYLNTGGGAVQQANYAGIYVIEEKIKRGPDRVVVDALQPENLQAPEVSGGYMLKIDRPDPGDSSFSAAGISELNYVDPKGPEIRQAARDPQEKYILGYLNSFGSALNGANFRNPTNGYAKFIDVPAWIDHHLLNVLSFNVDALRLSTYLYKPREGKLAFGPIWDFDRSLGSTDGRDSNPKVWSNSGGTSFFTYPWWSRLFQDTDFYQQWIDRYEQLRRDQFSLTNINRLIDELANTVRKAQPREQAKWGGYAPPRGGSYQGEVNLMKTYLKNRTDFMDAQFVRPPSFSIASGQVLAGTSVTLNGPANATIYYTLDGSDPRLSGGAISSNALIYSGPITLSGNAHLMARSRNPSHTLGPVKPSPVWSGYNEAIYVVQTPPLAITEIMFNPAPPVAGSTNSAQDFEYIELKNTGTTPLALAGYRLTNGIDFHFTAGTLNPGQRTVVVRNLAAFQARYGTAINVAGEFLGNLENSGERIVLRGPLDEPIADFNYDAGWHPITGGLGFALALRDENTPFETYGLAESWRAGAVGGTPGAPEETVPAVPGVKVNEVLTRTSTPGQDALELYNPLAEAADVGGWYVTDDFHTPRKYRIPAGTVIAPGGYLVLQEAQFNHGPTAFAFSSEGEEAWLFSADGAGNLTGYFQGGKFGAAATGVSFGRFVTSDGREQFVAQSNTSLGSANAAPAYGPVVLSEIMFQPTPNGTIDTVADEFLELQNVSGMSLPLFDPLHTTNTWRLRGGVDYDFPPNVSLPAGGLALLVHFDPQTNATVTAEFRARLAIPATAALFGPIDGKLDNDGEHLSLQRPDEPTANGTPYIIVDELTYGFTAPWPTNAAGNGFSLQRFPNSFADDPASWIAADPTPGVPMAVGNGDSDGDGLPDAWELSHQLNPNDASGEHGANGDPDHDGLTNLQEFRSGTDPRNASSVLQLAASRANGATVMGFIAAPGKSYSILASDAVNGPWSKLKDIAEQPVETSQQITDASTNATRFYRVVTPRQ